MAKYWTVVPIFETRVVSKWLYLIGMLNKYNLIFLKVNLIKSQSLNFDNKVLPQHVEKAQEKPAPLLDSKI